MRLTPQSIGALVVSFCLLTFCSSISLFGQTYKYKSYNESPGLPSYVSNELAQDANGRLWVSTSNGLAYFDGTEWTTVKHIADTIDAREYEHLEHDKNGNIYFFPKNDNIDIIKYDGKIYSSIKISQPDTCAFAAISKCFAATINGKMVIAYSIATSFRVNYQNKWYTYNKTNGYAGERILNIAKYKSSVVFCTEARLYEWSNGKLQFNINAIIPPSFLPVRGMTDEPSTTKGNTTTWMFGNTWVGYIENDRFTCINNSLNFIQNYDSGDDLILGDGNNRVFISTHLSCYYLEKSTKKIFNFSLRDQETITWFTDMIFDRENNLWFTSQRGVGKINSFNFVNYFPPVNNNDNEVSSIIQLENEKFFFGSKYGYYIFNNGKITTHEFTSVGNQPLSSNRIGDAIKDNKGQVYFIAGQLGICKLMPNEGYSVVIPFSNYPEEITSLTTDAQGTAIAVGSSSMYKLINGKLIFLEEIFTSQQYVRKLFFGKSGEYYIATTQGVFCRQNGKTQPLLFENKSDNVSAYCLVDDGSGNIIIGNTLGLFVYHNNKATRFKHHEFLNTLPVYFIQKDNKNNLWIGTNDGVWKLNRYHAWPYSTENGLSGRETNRSAICLDNKGRLWIGTNAGVSCYDQEYNLNNLQKPIINLLNVENSIGETYGLEHDFAINYSNNSLTFHFNAISLTNEKRNQVQVKLVGFDKDWFTLPKADLRNIRYTNLPSGNYFLKIRAKGDNGQWSDDVTSSQITINRAFYTRWWFFILVFIAATSIIYPLLKYLQQKRNASVLQEMVNERTHNLQSSENRLRSILEHSNDGILITDKFGKIINANDAFCKLTGLTQQEITKSTVEKLSADFKMDVPLTMDRYTEIFNEKEAHKGFESSAFINNEQRFLQINRVFIDAPAAGEVYMVNMFHDITDMKNTQQVLIKSKEIAETATATKSAFLASMSHEIRTPLNGIIGLADLMQHTPLDDEQQEFINGLQQSGRTLLALINDILDFSKIESGKMELAEESVYLPQLIEEVFEIISSKAVEKQIDFTYYIDEKVPTAIYSDSIRLKQILLNLLSNGIKFTDTGFVALNVKVNESGKDLQFMVRDSGIGISTENIGTLFNSFTQIKAHKGVSRGGTGLGLAISKRLASLMNGDISVVSESGKGSVFTLNMPCHESNDYSEFNKFIIDQKSLMHQLNNTPLFAMETQNVAIQNIMNEAKKYGINSQYISWQNFVSNIDSFVNQPIIIHQNDIESNEVISTWFAHNTKVLQGMMVLNFDARNQPNNYTAYTDKYSLPLRYRAFFKYVSNKVSRLNDLSLFRAPVIQNTTQPAAPKYLIVDDVPTNCMILSKLLANHGYQCDIAYNGVEAVTMATKTYYPVIFMDINMPEMDGWDASLAIRNTEIEMRRRSTIIAITANALEQDKQKCFDSGMDFYFSKPFDFKKLIDLLQAIEEETKAKINN